MVGSGPVVRRRASGTMTVRWSVVAGAQAVVDEGQFAVAGVQAAELRGRWSRGVARIPLTALTL